MSDVFQQISLLYELSTTLTHLKPEETAQNFLKKLLSRKNIKYGAIWLLSEMDEEKIFYSSLYSVPAMQEDRSIQQETFAQIFERDIVNVSPRSIFDGEHSDGYYAYFKLGELGILELFSKNRTEKIKLEALYPLKDVMNMLSTNLESGFSYQRLQKETAQRKRAEKSLKFNEEKLQRIVDNIELGLMEVDNDDIIQYANDTFCELVGYSLDDLIGQKAAELLVPEEDRDRIKEENAKRKKGLSSSYESQIKTKSGEKKWIIISGAPNYDSQGNQIGSIGIHLDITAQKSLASEYAFKESQLENLFEVSLDALISINQESEIIEWNPQAEIIFGHKRSQVLGKSLADTIIPTEFRSAHARGMSKFLTDGEGPVLNNRIEIYALRKNGEVFPIELTIFPIQYEDKYFFTAFVRDITELKKSREAMSNALRKQTELNNMKSKFVSMTSHELRTPLTTIRTDVELLEYHLNNQGELKRKSFENGIRRIDKNVDRLHQLINNILLVGQLDSHKVPFNPQSVDPHEFVEKHILPNYENKDRQLLVDVTGTPYDVELDKKLFTHIVDNLISNAYKYSEGKEQAPELHIDFSQEELVMKVRDYGIGIPEEEHEKLFNSFFRASNVGSIQGTGLGLSIVNEFVKLHEGTISVESKKNEGTTFILKFQKLIREENV